MDNVYELMRVCVTSSSTDHVSVVFAFKKNFEKKGMEVNVRSQICANLFSRDH